MGEGVEISMESRLRLDQGLPPHRLGLQGPAARVRGSADPEMSPAQLPQALTFQPLPAGYTVPWPSWIEGQLHYS